MTHPDAYHTVVWTELPCGHTNEFYDTEGETLNVYCVLCRAVRDAKVEAYEEAAQTAEHFSAQEPWYDTHSTEVGEADAIAADIRAVKESLLQEPVST